MKIHYFNQLQPNFDIILYDYKSILKLIASSKVHHPIPNEKEKKIGNNNLILFVVLLYPLAINYNFHKLKENEKEEFRFSPPHHFI